MIATSLMNKVALGCAVVLGLTGSVSAATYSRSTSLAVFESHKLLETMVGTTCFSMAGDNGAEFTSQTHGAVNRVDVLFADLLADPETAENMVPVITIWATLSNATRQVSAGDHHQVPMRQLLNLSDEIEAHVDRLKDDTVRSNAPVAVVLETATKNGCLVLHDVDRETRAEKLNANIVQIDRMVTGQPFIVQLAWKDYRAALTGTVAMSDERSSGSRDLMTPYRDMKDALESAARLGEF